MYKFTALLYISNRKKNILAIRLYPADQKQIYFTLVEYRTQYAKV